MKKRKKLLALLLTLCMVVSLLPTAVFAAEGWSDDEFARWEKYCENWKYKVTVDKDSVNRKATANVTDIRAINETLVYDLGEITYGEEVTTQGVELTFENIYSAETAVPNANKNNIGKVRITYGGSATKYVDLSWDAAGGNLDAVGKTSVLTVKPKAKAPAGEHEELLLFMEQNSRVGWSVKFKVNIKQKPINIILPKIVEKPYGKALKAEDITGCYEQGKESERKSLADFGVAVTLEGETENEKKDVGSVYSVTAKIPEKTEGNYAATFPEGKNTVTVKVVKAKPVRTWIKVDSISTSETLGKANIDAEYQNPYTLEKVPGHADWVDEEKNQTFSSAGTYTGKYKFTPESETNYEAVEDTATVYVVGDGNPGTDLNQTTLTLDSSSSLKVTYDGRSHGVTYTASSNATPTVKYRLAGDPGATWQEAAPVNAGTYDVLATVNPSGGCTGASASTQLVIEPKELPISVNIQDRPYTGDNVAYILSIGLSLYQSAGITDLVDENGKSIMSLNGWREFQEYFDARYDDAEVGNGKTVTVTAKKELYLTGNDTKTKNYIIPETIQTKGGILQKSISLSLNDGIVKHYGQTMEFHTTDYHVNSDLEGTDIVDDVKVAFSSDGMVATAKAGVYNVSAVATGNYSVSSPNVGQLKVVAAVPEEVKVASSQGTLNKQAKTIEGSLQGTFVNPHNGENVPGTVTLANEDKEKLLTEQTKLTYIFTPNDTENYMPTTGIVTVSGVEGELANIEVDGDTSFEYTGRPCEVKGKSSTPETIIKVEYKKPDESSWSETAPTNVGTYDVKITADAKNNLSFVDNSITTQMVITPVAPTGRATVSKINEGAMLSTSRITSGDIIGKDNKPVEGKISWDKVGEESPENIPVVKGAGYNWTFISNDTNYTNLTGSAIPCPKEESRPADSGNTGGGGGAGGGSGGGGGAAPEKPAPETPTGPVTNADGSVTETVKADDGTVTETTKWKDGTVAEKVIAPDGSSTEITKEPDGSVTEIVTAADGSSTSKATRADGVITETATTAAGTTTGTVSVPETVIGGTKVDLPKDLGEEEGRVTVRVTYPDGTVERVRGKYEDGEIALHVDGSATVEVLDNYVPYTAVPPFQDIKPDKWYYNAVWNSYYDGMMAGTSGTSFSPNTPTSRAMVATILWSLVEKPQVDSGKDYSDVESGSWYADAVQWASAEGIVSGRSDGSFSPSDAVTREQLAVMIYKYEQSKGGGFTGAWMFPLDFADRGDVSEWAYEALCWCTMNGVMSGKGNGVLDPKGQATRAEVAQMLNSYIEL